ncbi:MULTISPECIES: V-type ATP synthase subunit F [Carnobacterium]|uniref:V-type ATP synthase subunit F n=1 Tax=Carnobacterium TaxID=2747 RepID=UPI00054FF315|nr:MULTISPECIES: V-type ATP synthase subunit F [Carnobacterium]
MAHKIGVVGDKDSILPFKVLGFDIFYASGAKEARRIVDRLAKEEYGIIYLTEPLGKLIPETIERYDQVPKPAVILIPNHLGSLNIGKERIQQNVEKAVGQNIL